MVNKNKIKRTERQLIKSMRSQKTRAKKSHEILKNNKKERKKQDTF